MSPPRRRRKKPEDPEEHVNHERWLVTYADMLTLLMVLFIVMFAMSQVDQKKYNALKNGLADGFGATSSFMKGSDSILEGQLTEGSNPSLAGSKIFEQLSPAEQAVVSEVIAQEELRRQRSSYDAAVLEVDRLRAAEHKLKAALEKRGLADDVATTIDNRGLVVSLVSRHVVFQPNIARLSPRGREVVDTLAPVLSALGNDLEIDGHTNQAAGRPKYYATDWDLSAARAVEVLRRLNETAGIPGSRLSLAAFGHEKPLMEPSKPGSQAVNKRVDIVVLPDVSPASQQLLDEVAKGRFGERAADPAGTTGRTNETSAAGGDRAAGAGHSTEGGRG
ncbi:flagellar motor protein MotB [Nocardioides sp. LMS-CY]|uniref:OmpA/MotB family protein n=1 Tax=Nocardioides sp. (strain LMS-CY) TaxID=2840457 RepID=UPI001C00123A|nr:flagellar motor protein MotB [Nocardioides sp. LMS-CY]QWF23096.1 flagellar motor protein MotB [Nocardioides sp. LMS-CY]